MWRSMVARVAPRRMGPTPLPGRIASRGPVGRGMRVAAGFGTYVGVELRGAPDLEKALTTMEALGAAAKAWALSLSWDLQPARARATAAAGPRTRSERVSVVSNERRMVLV